MTENIMTSFSIGVDLGGTNLRAASYSPESGIRHRRSTPTRLSLGPQRVAEEMCALINDVLRAVNQVESLIGICVAAPGPLELPLGRFHQPPNLPGWDGFNLRETLEREFSVPITLENDANAAALAECHLGSGKELGLDNLCMLTLGTGVGGGLISGGQVVHGAHGLAGEMGHVNVWPDGDLCGCGNRGCLEAYASATGIHRQALAISQQNTAPGITALFASQMAVTAHDLYALAMEGDLDARSIFDRVGRALGISIASIINTLNPALVAIAGGASEAWPLFSPVMFQELTERSYIYRMTQAGSAFARRTLVRQAHLGADAGLMGAALYPFVSDMRNGL